MKNLRSNQNCPGWLQRAFQSTAAVLLLNSLSSASALTVSTVAANPAGTEVYVQFSDPLCTSTPGATHLPNYTISGAAGTVIAATMLSDQQTVRLDVAPAVSGTRNLTVNSLVGFEIYDFNCGFSNFLFSTVTSFTVSPALTGPTIVALTPATVSADCGSTVTLHGAGFDPISTVRLMPGSIPLTILSQSGTIISVSIPGLLTPGSYSLVVDNPIGAAAFPGQSSPPAPLTVASVRLLGPVTSVGACGPEPVAFVGKGICPGATLTAVKNGGGPTVIGSSVTVNAGGNLVTALFDFSTVPPGGYDVTVQNPGGSSFTIFNLIQAYTISSWGYPNPPSVGNCGTETVTLTGIFCPLDEMRLVPVSAGPVINSLGTPTVTPAPWWKVMTANFDMTVAVPGDYKAEIRKPSGTWIPTAGVLKVVNAATCPVNVEVVGRTTVGYTVVNPYTFNLRNVSCTTVAASTFTVSFPPSDNPVITAPTAGGVVSPANVVTFSIPSLIAGQVYPVSFDLLLPNLNTTATMTAVESLSSCSPVVPIQIVASQDPNAKYGLPGIGLLHGIVGNEVLPYEIHFENIRTATAPAQDVFIYDRLNPVHFDLSTFSLGDISFGNRIITPPPGLTRYSTIVPHDHDGDPATVLDQMLVVIDAALINDPLSPDYGRINWSYHTLDPATMATPGNPLLGFLPPNTLPPIGQGSVKFNVQLNPGLANGTQMGGAAEIIFDANAPIWTAPWFNRIVQPVALDIRRITNSASLRLEWIAPAGLFKLESTPQLGAGATWTNVPGTPGTIGELQRVTIAPTNGMQRYFRLRF